ncbi:amino acid adenylation domain-containing protein [Nocardioides speluncae]|uniref:amino acid adenylation domain-containing protein n=1 Tax=Nocardioides speluncae TaxID=2670337 RepID=UPI000D69E64D|nr:amino acid adenylation domain-containing protein [Nocardioides speluncae]
MPAVVAAPRAVADLCAHAERAGDQAAVVHGDESVSYAELWRRVELAAREYGARPGVVRVATRHAPDTVVSLFGAWLAGGSYCPLDPRLPADHAARLLAGTAAEALPADTAYVLFTSGSTGRPKPVPVPHGAVDAVVPALRELFAITPEDRVLQFASLSWDTCFEEILPTLTGGATLVFDAEAHTGSLPRFLRMVARQAITVLDLPTAFWHELVHHLAETREPLPNCLRLVVIGGEAANPARLAEWHALDTARIQLLNTYGATETALITHAAELTGLTGADVPIGTALPHVREHLTEDGELWVGGPSLASGYLGLPEETAERFVTCGGQRFYRTGDRVRRAGPHLLHLGRLDAQVKVRGIRVDPGEVEAHLLAHPAVTAAAVTGVTVSERTVLAAYVVATAVAGDLPAELRSHLQDTAPAHLLPARIAVVPELVRTASGKVDRRATHERYAPPPATTTHQEATP